MALQSSILGRYNTPSGARLLTAQRAAGVTHVTDSPASSQGLVYKVDEIPDVEGPDAVIALVDDYVAQARAFAAIPMRQTLIANAGTPLPA
jgi:hypothetical protein